MHEKSVNKIKEFLDVAAFQLQMWHTSYREKGIYIYEFIDSLGLLNSVL